MISPSCLCVHDSPRLSSVALKENGRRQKTMVCEKFDQLYSMLEEKKREMSQKVTEEQEEKLNYIRGLTRKYGDHLEQSCKVVEMGIQTMEEPEMALFLQVRRDIKVDMLPISNEKNSSYFFYLPQNTKPLLKKWVHVLCINAINNNCLCFSAILWKI